MDAIVNRLDVLRQKLSLLAAGQDRLRERVLAELEFAQAFVTLETTQAKSGRWAQLIDQAYETLEGSLAAAPQALSQAVEKVEEILAPIGRVAKDYTVHCVGHAHIDMNWMWSWPETVATTNDTFTTMLKLMEEYPDFCFSQSQASVYLIAKQYNPELFAQIKRRIKEGRWEVTASHWVEGDKNLASGESLTRHLLYTRRFMKENFGLSADDITVDWSPDTFGHAWTIPGIDARGGVKFYYLCRPGPMDRRKQPIFWWEGPDGSRVLVNAETHWYNNHIGPHYAPTLPEFWKITGLKDFMVVYGVGDHGGGPTQRDILYCREMNTWPIYPNFRLGTARNYFNIVAKQAKDFPVLKRELNFEFSGCYTSQTLIKRINRYGEKYSVEAETAAAIAWRALGRKYPATELRDIWRDVLFTHFHDILPGSGVRATRDYTHGMFQNVAAATSMIRTNSYRAIASAVDTSFGAAELPEVPVPIASKGMGGGMGRETAFGALSPAGHVHDGPRPFVVFNPTAWNRRELVNVSIWDAHTGSGHGDLASKKFRLRGPDGTLYPVQRIGEGLYWGHFFVDVAFPVEVPSLGYTSFVVEEGEAPQLPLEKQVRVSGTYRGHDRQPTGKLAIENEFLYVEFDSLTGGVVKLVDKASGADLADPSNPLGVCEYIVERHTGMAAWTLGEPMEVRPLMIKQLEVVRQGVCQASVQADAVVNDSTVTITYTLSAGSKHLEITVKSRWVERGYPEKGMPGLRMRFPTVLANPHGRYEIPFGSIERDLTGGEEVPSQRWAEVVGEIPVSRGKPAQKGSCVVLNDSKYGHSLTGSTLRVNLIRSSYNPDPLPEIGDHEIRLAIAPRVGEQPAAELIRMGAAFNQPLAAVATDAHEGRLASEAALLSISQENVIVSAVKKAEDENALIVRLFETQGKAVTAQVELNRAVFGKTGRVAEVDLLEQPAKKSTAKVIKGGFSVSVPAYGIASVKVTLAE